jgi:hypothetical protein
VGVADFERATLWWAAGVSDVECTALGAVEGDTRNLLMAAPCSCPACTAAAAEAGMVDDRRWLRITGQRQRFRVEAVDLGPVGRSLLG